MIRSIPSRLRRGARGAIAAALLASLPLAGQAQSLLRDAGMEHGLNTVARPILIAAGLPSRNTRILIVNDMSMNAFVVDSRAIFVHAGLLLRMRSVEQLQAVIAHEAAHIANGHFARRRINAASSRTAGGIGALVGLAAGLAVGNPALGIGAAAGSLGSARGVFLTHTRAEEAAADRSALRYLASAGVDPWAMREVLNLFAGQEALSVSRRDAYAGTHPLTDERLRSVAQLAETLRPSDVDHTLSRYWFDRAQGKLSAYLRSPSYTFRRTSGASGDDAVLSRAMAHFRNSDIGAARREMAGLVAARPDDAYLHELLGWFELESGNVDRAIASYRRAAELAPSEPLLMAGYGRALLAQDTSASNAEALEILSAARARDGLDTRVLRDLALAHARAGENGMASAATAERYALMGRWDDADLHANRAVGALPAGSPGWARAQDIIRAAARAEDRR